MPYEVVVVGGGIGGLTTAAVLAARGVNVCLLERQPTVGGCVSPFEKFGYSFTPGYGLFPCWDETQIHQRIFAELPVAPPKVTQLDPSYLVRFTDRPELTISKNDARFRESLSTTFAECAHEAIAFFEEAEAYGQLVWNALENESSFPFSGHGNMLQFSKLTAMPALKDLVSDITSEHLRKVSPAFLSYLDAQLEMFAQAPASDCSYLFTCMLAAVRSRGLFKIQGDVAALTETLASSIRTSGGTIRLNAPVLRLAYDVTGQAVGVHLLSGETVIASKAIISNLPVWDTYGKLVGLDKTPAEVRQRLRGLNSTGLYQIFLGIDQINAEAIPAQCILAVNDRPSDEEQVGHFVFSMTPPPEPGAPQGKRAAVVHVPVDVTEWFTYHIDESQHEEQDRDMLELVWSSLQCAIPELGEAVELIETATPRTWYEATRRKLGMVGGLPQTVANFGPGAFSQETAIENLFLVGDTVFPGPSVAGVSYGALMLANRITGRKYRV